MTEREIEGPTATIADTRAAILKQARRSSTPIRRTFVQTPQDLAEGREDRRGPLAWFVRTKNHRALLAYLLLVGAISSGKSQFGWSLSHDIRVLARYFGTTEHATPASASNAVSKILSKLEECHLISRQRRGRQRKVTVTLLREDGSGAPYDRPLGGSVAERFLKLPHEFWSDGWAEKLSLPAVAMLLVLLAEKRGVRLPTEKMPKWYGWSADTAERGLAELDNYGIVAKVRHREKAPLSPVGYTIINSYYLQPPFSSNPFTPAPLVFAEIAAASNLDELLRGPAP